MQPLKQPPALKNRPWFKSSRSQDGGNCVEVAYSSDDVMVRDSKDPDGAVLRFDRQAWKDLVDGAKDGEFDLD